MRILSKKQTNWIEINRFLRSAWEENCAKQDAQALGIYLSLKYNFFDTWPIPYCSVMIPGEEMNEIQREMSVIWQKNESTSLYE